MLDRSTQLVEWGVASVPCSEENICGDQHLVKPFSNGVLIAVVDGLGHGIEAKNAASIAVATLEKHANESLTSLVRRCHEALIKTRGVVMSLASFNASDATVSWVGVGNVEGLLVRADITSVPAQENILVRGGVVGYQISPPLASVLTVMPGDTLILATDGIRRDFATSVRLNDQPQKIADHILATCLKGNDDALVLVTRWRGRHSESG
ncbi:MAG: SpoIIE family protein phosphatase [Acidobacteria bacterium]|nr:SpoIIE family protein phosphatase [Acidobacteriota bacterium]